MGPEEGSLALEKLCGLAFVSRAQGRGGIGMMTTGVSIPLGSFNVPGLLLAAVLAVILNLVLPKESQGEKPVTATTAAEAPVRSRSTTSWSSPKALWFPIRSSKGSRCRESCALARHRAR